MSRAATIACALGFVAACAPADPGWSDEHPARPAAPVGAEAPVAAVLREEPAPPPASENAHHQHHHGGQPSDRAEDPDAM